MSEQKARRVNQERTSLATAIAGMKHWDWCPICRGGLDTGLECDQCGADLMPIYTAFKESLSGGNPGEPNACTGAEERGISGATGAGQHPDDNSESTGDSADRRSPDGTDRTPSPDESNRHPHEPKPSEATGACAACGYAEKEHHHGGASYGVCGRFVHPGAPVEPLADPIVPIEIGAGKIRVAICYDIGDPDKVLRELVIYDDGEGFKPVGTDLPEHRGKKVPDVGRVLARLHISNAEGAAVFVRDLQTVVEHARVADGGAALTKSGEPT